MTMIQPAKPLTIPEYRALVKELEHNRRRRQAETSRPTMNHVDKGREAKRPGKASRGQARRVALREYQ